MKNPLFTFLSAIGLSVAITSAAPRPNIILAMADDMGWGDPGYNSMMVTYADGSAHPDQGWIDTPTMDTMAANGLRFERFYSASAVCSPTRASCLTGRNPFRVGVPDANSGRLEFDETPLSEVLSAAGYQCGHFGKWHLGAMTTLRSDSNRGGDASVYSAPWHHGYDFCFATESKVPTYHPYRRTNNSLSLPTGFTDSNFYGTRYWKMPATWNELSGEGVAVPVEEVNNAIDGDDSKLMIDQALPFIQDAVANGKPFFLVLWFHTPHKPLVDPDGVTGTNSTDSLKDSIEDFDHALGRVRDELTTLGVRGNTMFWVTSDNGPENGVDSLNETDTVRSIRSGRLLERKRSLHEGGVRVPGILEWPDAISTGMSTGFPAITSDYYPTILDYLCLSVPNQKPLDGVSLRPVIEGSVTSRSKPIGFKITTDNSWMNQQYKLIDDGTGWELYDLINIASGEEVEQTPLATAANIDSQTTAIQNVYNTMLAEFSAWDATLSADTPYVHASQPTVTLSTPATTLSGPFTVTATFSEAVTQLNANEFIVTGGTPSNLTGGGTTWTVAITPSSNSFVNVSLPEGGVIDADGNLNAASNQLSITDGSPTTNDGTTIATTLSPSGSQTVDSVGNVPADEPNNPEKFTAGTINDGVAAPYTTTFYVRGTQTQAVRQVRAFTRFELSSLSEQPISSATLLFNGYSLNDQFDINIQATALGTDWSESGAPLPNFNHTTVGSAVDGGSIISNLDSTDHAKDYTIDVTDYVRNWLDGTWPNYGVQLSLSSTTINNGLGIQTSGEGAFELVIEQTPLNIFNFHQAPAVNDVTLQWNSVEGALYRIEANDDLLGTWTDVGNTTGAVGDVSSFTHLGGMSGFEKRFYRVVFLSY